MGVVGNLFQIVGATGQSHQWYILHSRFPAVDTFGRSACSGLGVHYPVHYLYPPALGKYSRNIDVNTSEFSTEPLHRSSQTEQQTEQPEGLAISAGHKVP
jgi:hypothetical protein